MFKYLVLLLLLPSVVNASEFEIIKGDLVDLCSFVSEQTQTNIVVQGDADFPITAICPTLESDNYIPFLKSVVVANGGSLVFKDNIYTVTLTTDLDTLPEDEPTFIDVYTVENCSAEILLSSLSILGVKGSVISNRIVLSGPEIDVKRAVAVFKSLDEVQVQYIVEAVIFEIRESDYQSMDYSIDLSSTDVFTRLTDVFGGLSPLAFPVGLSTGITTPDFNLVIQAIESSSDGSMLSTPRVVISDTKRGSISVGQNLPFLTGRYEDSEGDTPFQTIERKDVGVALSVVPYKVNSDYVRLLISQSASSVNTTVVASDIVTNMRSLNTEVVAQVGDYVYLGGLQDKTDEEVISSIPLLSKIPFIGDWFFTFRKAETVNRNLNILFRVTTV